VGKDVVDLVICFECSRMKVYRNGAYSEEVVLVGRKWEPAEKLLREELTPVRKQLSEMYLGSQKAEKGVAFQASLTIENPAVKKAATKTITRPDGTVMEIRESPRIDCLYNYVLDGGNLRRDETQDGKVRSIAIHRNGLTLHFRKQTGTARIQNGVDFEATRFDPRCIGLPRQSDNLATYLSTLTSDDAKSLTELPQNVATVEVKGKDAKGRGVTLVLTSQHGYRPGTVSYRNPLGQVESVTYLSYEKYPFMDGWYVSSARQYLFGKQQPKGTDEKGIEAERSWVTKMTYTVLTPPKQITPEEVDRAIDFMLPAGTSVADATTGRGFTTGEADSTVPWHAIKRTNRGPGGPLSHAPGHWWRVASILPHRRSYQDG
jgi:hypothetical protein